MTAALAEPDVMLRRASFEAKPSTWNAEARTIQVIAATETPVPEFNENGRYFEVLAITTAALDATRLDGMAALNSHRRSDLKDQLGVVLRHWIESRQLILEIKMSDREDNADIVDDIVAGIIRWVSISYQAIERKPRAPISGLPAFTVTRWQPLEISFVSVPADPASKVRSKSMTDATTAEPTASAKERAKRPGDELTFDILRRGWKEDWAVALIADFEDRAYPIDRARDALIDERARLADETAVSGTHTADFDYSPRGLSRSYSSDRGRGHPFAPRTTTRSTDRQLIERNEGRIDALHLKMTGTGKPTDKAKPFAGMSSIEIGRDFLEDVGISTRSMGDARVVDMLLKRDLGGLHGTDDFPSLLGSAAGRVLMDSYEAAASAWKIVSRPTTLPDFKLRYNLRLGEHPVLPEVQEHGEIKRKTLAEGGESYRLKTYASIFGITRQALINDSLGAFAKLPILEGQAAAETENQILNDLITANPALADTVALFHSTHGNLGTAGAISDTTLTEAFLKLRSQKGLDGVTPVRVAPRYLIVGPTYEAAALKAVAAITPATTATANVYAGRLEVLVEPRITGNAWYIFADPASVPVIEYAHLESAQGPQLIRRDGWDVLGTEFRVVLDFGAGIIDFRGAVKNAGA